MFGNLFEGVPAYILMTVNQNYIFFIYIHFLKEKKKKFNKKNTTSLHLLEFRMKTAKCEFHSGGHINKKKKGTEHYFLMRTDIKNTLLA